MSRLTRSRWTHIALPSSDIDRSVEWYTEFTPLVVVETFSDDDGRSAWLSNEGQVETPMILVLVMFYRDQGRAQPQLTPFGHIGIEVVSRDEIDEVAARARERGCLAMEPVELPAPVGYICMITDPDGNRIEMSHGQQVFEKVNELWG